MSDELPAWATLHGDALMQRLRDEADDMIASGISPDENPELFMFPLGYRFSPRQMARYAELGLLEPGHE